MQEDEKDGTDLLERLFAVLEVFNNKFSIMKRSLEEYRVVSSEHVIGSAAVKTGCALA